MTTQGGIINKLQRRQQFNRGKKLIVTDIVAIIYIITEMTVEANPYGTVVVGLHMRTFSVSMPSLVDLEVFLVYKIVITEADPSRFIKMPLMDFLYSVMRIECIVNIGFGMVDDNVASPRTESSLFFELESWANDYHNGWNERNKEV